MALTHEMEKVTQAKEITTAHFMDVNGAFGNVFNVCLLLTQQQHGYPTAIEFWVEHFLSSKTTALACARRKEDLSPVWTRIP
jgi:hypothetical protein